MYGWQLYYQEYPATTPGTTYRNLDDHDRFELNEIETTRMPLSAHTTVLTGDVRGPEPQKRNDLWFGDCTLLTDFRADTRAEQAMTQGNNVVERFEGNPRYQCEADGVCLYRVGDSAAVIYKCTDDPVEHPALFFSHRDDLEVRFQ